MLHSIDRMKDEIKKILLDKDQLIKIENIDFIFLKSIFKFLLPFTECSERFSMEKIPTITDYVLWFQRLLKTCVEDAFHSLVMSKVKSITKTNMIKRMTPDPIHYIALFLNPPFKELKFCTQQQKDMVFATITSMSNAVTIDLNLTEQSLDEASSTKSNPFWEYMDLSQSSLNQNNNIEYEIRTYQKIKVKPDSDIRNMEKNCIN